MRGATLDIVEFATSAAVSGALGLLGTSLVVSNPILNVACAIGSAVGGCCLYDKYFKYLKNPLIEREIESIVRGSKDDIKPTALFIHTKNDHNGACSDFHALVEPYRICARGFSIDRIRGLDYQKRFQVQGKKYDVVLLLAHADPFSIAMDGDGLFSSFHAERQKHLNFLAQRIKVGGKLILDCCSTAQGEDNIARTLSEKIPHATVYGSSTFVYAPFGSQYALDMTPTFKSGPFFQKNTTRIYKAGALIPLQS